MICLLPSVPEADMEQQCRIWFPQLPPERQRKLLHYHLKKDRWLCAAAYMVLSHMLYNNYDIRADSCRFGWSEFGKPFLQSHPDIHFNLSHCDQGVVCITGCNPVGIDIETLRTGSPALLNRILSEQERSMLAQSSSPASAFTKIWTLKESWLKAIGTGFEASPRDCCVQIDGNGSWLIHQNGFLAEVAWSHPAFTISVCRTQETAYSLA